MAECLCDRCTALCCRYFALPIETPETADDFDDIRWYISHEGVTIYVEEGTWYVNLTNKCKHLTEDNRCGIYETRPQICRDYKTDGCDYHGGGYDYDHYFVSIEQIEAYAKKVLSSARNSSAGKSNRSSAKPKKRKPRRSPAALSWLAPQAGKKQP